MQSPVSSHFFCKAILKTEVLSNAFRTNLLAQWTKFFYKITFLNENPAISLNFPISKQNSNFIHIKFEMFLTFLISIISFPIDRSVKFINTFGTEAPTFKGYFSYCQGLISLVVGDCIVDFPCALESS